MLDLTTLFCSIDDFLKEFEINWNRKLFIGSSSKGPKRSLSLSEIVTILVLFHQSNFRNFKYFYFHLKKYFSKEFPNLLSYTKFISIKKKVLYLYFLILCIREEKSQEFHLSMQLQQQFVKINEFLETKYSRA